MDINSGLSLAELSGSDWGEIPESARATTRERMLARRKALRDVSFAELAMLLKVDFERDADFLVPYSVGRLSGTESWDPEASLELLLLVLRNRRFNWYSNKRFLSVARGISWKRLDQLDDQLSSAESSSDHEAFYKTGFSILSEQNAILREVALLDEYMTETEKRSKSK